MPPLSKFPKSQQVTYKYYEGVLRFLEEDYVQVWTRGSQVKLRGVICLLLAGRATSHRGMEHVSQGRHEEQGVSSPSVAKSIWRQGC